MYAICYLHIFFSSFLFNLQHLISIIGYHTFEFYDFHCELKMLICLQKHSINWSKMIIFSMEITTTLTRYDLTCSLNRKRLFLVDVCCSGQIYNVM